MRKILVLLAVMVAGTAGADAPAQGSADPTSIPQAQLRQRCVDAMNADPQFAASIVATVDRQLDAKTVAAHADADYHIRKNERHVIYAYAALWVIAAAFVWFMHRRQAALTAEIAALRRDLEAAGKEAT